MADSCSEKKEGGNYCSMFILCTYVIFLDKGGIPLNELRQISMSVK